MALRRTSARQPEPGSTVTLVPVVARRLERRAPPSRTRWRPAPSWRVSTSWVRRPPSATESTWLPSADPEHGHAALERRAHELDLERVVRRVARLGRSVRLLAVPGRVDVVSARDLDAVHEVEQRIDVFHRRRAREQERQRAEPLKRLAQASIDRVDERIVEVDRVADHRPRGHNQTVIDNGHSIV